MDLFELQHEVANWSMVNFPKNQPYHPLVGIMEEVGELAHAHLKMEQGIRGDEIEHKVAKLDAVGDIVIYLADYCARNDISLGLAVESTWQIVKQRNWRKNPTTGGE